GFYKKDHNELGYWQYVLAGIMLGLSLLMISDIRYPSFKKVGLRTRGNIGAIVIAIVVLFMIVRFHHVMPVILFSLFLVYGFIRPWVSQRVRKEIEVETDDEPQPLPEATGSGNKEV
ncbi:MAG: hypothetical protein HC767_12400, partial [Akkermansiaceae bacterium]|nr:hypothetical protein [Akkermansiaceae bacterium]